MNAKQFEKLVGKIVKNPKAYGLCECSLCGREHIHFVGVLFPGEEAAQALQQPAGKHRSVLYGLCEECASRGKAAADEVEDNIIKQAREGTILRNMIS